MIFKFDNAPFPQGEQIGPLEYYDNVNQHSFFGETLVSIVSKVETWSPFDSDIVLKKYMYTYPKVLYKDQ